MRAVAIKWTLLAASLALLGAAVPAGAAAGQTARQATVAVVQMPAWLERNGVAQPLRAGMDMRNGDRIRTGSDARAVLKLAEGSSLKLGENTALDFYSRSLKPSSNFKGAFDLKTGALRFTAALHASASEKRDITLRIGGKTSAAVGSADLWASAEPTRDHLLLIAGRTEVRHGEQTLEMAEPLSAFSIGKGDDDQEVRSLDAGQLQQRVQATAINPGHGVIQPGSAWRVLLASAGSQPEALALYDRARAAGYAVQIKVRGGGKEQAERWQYDVVVAELASQSDAAVLAGKIGQQLGVVAQAGK